MKVKRWLLLSLVGIVLVLAGFSLMHGSVFNRPEILVSKIIHDMLDFVPSPRSGLFIFLAGLIFLIWGLLQVFKSVLSAVMTDREGRLVDIIFFRRYLRRGPKIVAIGGGTGLSVMLRGLKNYTSNITAIVTVADDGGSSGRLRGDLGILPPGDIRSCLAALADKEDLMEQMLRYRFNSGELAGHNLGNLFLAALNDMSGGFDSAVRSLSKVLAIRGQVLPVTLQNVNLAADLEDGTTIYGESSICKSQKRIKRVYLYPANCLPLPEALEAIKEADAIILGPGSLYTSIIPNLLVIGIPDAIMESEAVKIYVSNVMTQPGETDDFSATDHLQAIISHGGPIIDYMIVNRQEIPSHLLKKYRMEGSQPVRCNIKEAEKLGVKVVIDKLVHETDVVRHHPDKLAAAIMRLLLVFRKKNKFR
jgi:uncharacterized cofD-like protein